MSLKIRDFASNSEENVSGRTKDEIRLSPEDDPSYYDPPRRSHEERPHSSSSRRSDSRRRSYSRDRSPSRGPRFGDVPRFRDEKPFFGPRDHEGNIQVNDEILFRSNMLAQANPVKIKDLLLCRSAIRL